MSQYLRISDNHRFLVNDKGEEFFWLGDTGWEMLHRLDRQEIEHYFRNRSEKGFTVIQTVIVAELEGLSRPNKEGNLPFHDLDPEKPDTKYFQLVDFAVKKAREYDLYLALLPTWGSYLIGDRFHGNEQLQIFNEKNAYSYGRFLGERYKNDPNIVWILGGDRPADSLIHVWNAMAKGLEEGDEGKHLISYHPRGQQTSSKWFHSSSWLDFHMVQTGHQQASFPVYDFISSDYELENPKPVLNGEPAYEGIGIYFNPANPRHDDYEIRKQAYWSVFAGAFGHTYGNNNIWQMYQEGYKSVIWADTPWDIALEHPGSGQLAYLRKLMESRPFLSRIPSQDLLSGENPSWSSDHIQVCRDGHKNQKDASYIMIYLPVYRGFEVSTDCIPSRELNVWWFDTTTGNSFFFGKIENTGDFKFDNWNSFIKEGQGGPDWVVVIDNADKNYPAPGN